MNKSSWICARPKIGNDGKVSFQASDWSVFLNTAFSLVETEIVTIF